MKKKQLKQKQCSYLINGSYIFSYFKTKLTLVNIPTCHINFPPTNPPPSVMISMQIQFSNKKMENVQYYRWKREMKKIRLVSGTSVFRSTVRKKKRAHLVEKHDDGNPIRSKHSLICISDPATVSIIERNQLCIKRVSVEYALGKAFISPRWPPSVGEKKKMWGRICPIYMK